MKTYKGKGTGSVEGPKEVYVELGDGKGHPLTHIERHSPDGFNWGYSGRGPADLALAILVDCLGEDEGNLLYQDFKWMFIAKLHPEENWEIKEEDIRKWIRWHNARDLINPMSGSEARCALIKIAEGTSVDAAIGLKVEHKSIASMNVPQPGDKVEI